MIDDSYDTLMGKIIFYILFTFFKKEVYNYIYAIKSYLYLSCIEDFYFNLNTHQEYTLITCNRYCASSALFYRTF